MKTSDAVIIIFCKVVLPSTARLASYLKLSLTLGSLMSLCVFLLWDRVWGIGHADSLQFDAVRCNFPRAAAFSDKHNALLCVCDFLHLFLAHQVLLFVCCRFIQSTLLYCMFPDGQVFSSVFSIWLLQKLLEVLISTSGGRFKL